MTSDTFSASAPDSTPDPWADFLDDASGRDVPVTGLVGSRVVADVDLPAASPGVPLRVTLGTGAGGFAGPVSLAAGRGLVVSGYEVALQDAQDPASNVRRIAAAVADLELGTPVFVRVDDEPTSGWLAAADEVAAADLRLSIPLSAWVEPWVDAALDRELAFSVHGGTVADAVAAVRVTARLWGDADDLVAARRWCRSWRCADVAAAVAHVEAL